MKMLTNSVYVGRKIEIFPTDEQKSIINRYIDLYRAVYNWGLEFEETNYKKWLNHESDRKFYNFYDLCKKFVSCRRRMSDDTEWMREIPLTTAKLALHDLVVAYKKFFTKINNYPKYKTRKESPKSFKTRKDRCYLSGDMLRIEGLPKGDMIKCSTDMYDGFSGSHNTNGFCDPCLSINRDGKYFLSFQYEVERSPITDIEPCDPIGIDLGVRQTFVLSTGEVFNQPKDMKLRRKRSRQERHLQKDYKRMRKELSRLKTETGNEALSFDDMPKSNRCLKREAARRKTVDKIINRRDNFYHNTIKNIVKRNPKAICLETIRVTKIYKEKPYMRKHMDWVKFYQIDEIFRHKCDKYDVPIIFADDDFPSSQLCSSCGYRYHNIGDKKTYECPICGMKMDRDLNAAINLKNLYYTENI